MNMTTDTVKTLSEDAREAAISYHRQMVDRVKEAAEAEDKFSRMQRSQSETATKQTEFLRSTSEEAEQNQRKADLTRAFATEAARLLQALNHATSSDTAWEKAKAQDSDFTRHMREALDQHNDLTHARESHDNQLKAQDVAFDNLKRSEALAVFSVLLYKLFQQHIEEKSEPNKAFEASDQYQALMKKYQDVLNAEQKAALRAKAVKHGIGLGDVLRAACINNLSFEHMVAKDIYGGAPTATSSGPSFTPKPPVPEFEAD